MNNHQDIKVMITGSTGFIGQTLSQFYKQKAVQVVELNRANCDYNIHTLVDVIKVQKPDLFIHAAGSASVINSYASPAEARQGSVDLTEVVLNALAQAQTATRLIHFSSAAVYGNPLKLPIAEDAPLRPISPYGENKLESERLVESYTSKLAINPLTVRIFSLFGERQRRLVLYELFQQFSDSDSKTVKIRGTGRETRDFLSIGVFCQKLGALIEENPNIPVINIASGEAYSILDAAQTMAALLGAHDKPIICSGEEMTGNPPYWQADTSLYDQIVRQGILFDFAGELSKTLAQWKTQKKT
jgi:UDP-glucose 4-epimerase